ncbi:hypothetical protein PR048_017069 [Dryococelus australis]|uniref:Uncharacterized protein n=1 Tax=Dryococelus australis TaxID=614101 RepID=A0ABQ9H8H2_9NEOP|nr:hypothetical protein PR048_017069 [Dryococelus australis]
MNPADMANRGCSAEVLLLSKLWEVPEWLKKAPSEWPVSSCMISGDEINLEHNCQHPGNKKSGELDVAEIGNVEEHLIKLIQKESFHGVANEFIPSLLPFEDEHGILRIKNKDI